MRQEKETAQLRLVEVRQTGVPNLISTQIRDKQSAMEAMKELIGDLDREVFAVLNLNAKGDVLGASICSVGTVNQTLASPPEIFRSAILDGAASILALHNHPSGDPTPSGEDILLTKRLGMAGRMIGVELIDHVILGNQTAYSFQESAPSVLKADWKPTAATERSVFREAGMAQRLQERILELEKRENILQKENRLMRCFIEERGMEIDFRQFRMFREKRERQTQKKTREQSRRPIKVRLP